MRAKYLFYILLFLSIVGWGPLTIFSSMEAFYIPGTDSWIEQEIKIIKEQAKNIDPKVLKLSLTAYQNAIKQGVNHKGLITIIDYSKPSSERRLWVVDLNRNKVLFNTHVAHGKNSGTEKSTSFSNQPNSLKSSFGVFVTDEVYSGKDGYSMRIQGLERGINDNVYRRNVVFHGASYVSAEIAESRGMVGRSWGCMAVARDIVKPLINTIKNHTLVFAYYPDRDWLRHSTFLTS